MSNSVNFCEFIGFRPITFNIAVHEPILIRLDLLGGSICEEIPPNLQQIDTKGLSTESGIIFYAY